MLNRTIKITRKRISCPYFNIDSFSQRRNRVLIDSDRAVLVVCQVPSKNRKGRQRENEVRSEWESEALRCDHDAEI